MLPITETFLDDNVTVKEALNIPERMPRKKLNTINDHDLADNMKTSDKPETHVVSAKIQKCEVNKSSPIQGIKQEYVNEQFAKPFSKRSNKKILSDADREKGSVRPKTAFALRKSKANTSLKILSSVSKAESQDTFPKPKKQKSTDGDQSESCSSNISSDEDVPCTTVVSSRMAQRDSKQKLIARVLCRWWYALDSWPPEDFDYASELQRRRYKTVPLDHWEAEDDVDKNGFTKVYPIPHYSGIYRDPKGNAIDIRPLKGKPCYLTMSLLSELELTKLLCKALTNQLSCVENSPYANTEKEVLNRLKSELKAELSEAQERLERLMSSESK